MHTTFYKYQGTGNDFVMIDNRTENFLATTKVVANLCHRKYGVGADGLILLENAPEADFKMVYFNADGNQSTMCGNGGRCLVKFAQQMGVIENKAKFIAIDGMHHAEILPNGEVSLHMIDAQFPVEKHSGFFIDTGSPHHVANVADVENLDVFAEGKKLRNAYGTAGANVNFVTEKDNQLHVRTFERGVEDETLSCGTGVTAAALVAHQQNWIKGNNVVVNTCGGTLQVRFEKNKNLYKNVWLQGPATAVFEGKIVL